MYQPDKLSKYGWENGVGMSAQDQSAYMTGDETELQMQFVDAVNNATSVSEPQSMTVDHLHLRQALKVRSRVFPMEA